MRALAFLVLAAIPGFFLCLPCPASAHFGTITASPTALDQYHRQAVLEFSFIHPFQQDGMDLARPAKAAVVHLGSSSSEDITEDLEPVRILGHRGWKTEQEIRRPGAYCVYMEPRPYWEEAEDIFIKHYTKTYLGAYGSEQGWSEPVGLKTEIVPLVRPFGLYAGNVFRGRVLLDGKPVPHAEVEVEFLNTGSKAQAPNGFMVTQTVRADERGLFVYSPPHPGWWGFSALNEADYTIKRDGEPKGVELGAVVWVRFLPWQE
jgi:cobalt/nickel transport protein